MPVPQTNLQDVPPRRATGPWTMQAPPVDPEETRIRMRAQSFLSGPELGQCPVLTLAQALDVLAWGGQPI